MSGRRARRWRWALIGMWLAAWALFAPLPPPPPADAQSAPYPDVTIDAPSAVQAGARFNVRIEAVNRGGAARNGGINVSVPGVGDLSIDSVAPSTPGCPSSKEPPYACVFRPGDTVTNLSSGQRVGLTYPMADLYYGTAWASGQTRAMSVSLVAPRNVSVIQVQFRATLRGSDNGLVNDPPAGVKDQQGLAVYVAEVRVVQAPAPSRPPPTEVPPRVVTVVVPPPAPPPAPARAPEPFLYAVRAPDTAPPGQPFDIFVEAENRGGPADGGGSLSVSLPDVTSARIVSASTAVVNCDDGAPTGTEYACVIPPGAKAGNADGQSISLRYPLAEIYVKDNWTSRRSMTIRVTPGDSGTFRVLARFTMSDGRGHLITDPPAGSLGEQGWPVAAREVRILAPAAAPTAPPTATTAPTPTALPTSAPTLTAQPTVAASPVAPTTGAVATAPPGAAQANIAGAGQQPDGTLSLVMLVAVLLAGGGVAGGVVIASRRPRAPVMTPPPGTPPGPGAGHVSSPVGGYPPGPGGVFTPAPAVPTGYQIVGGPMSGGMATVYRARQPALARDVALKVLKPELAADATFVQRFIDEGKRTANLHHPNIVTIYDIGQVGGRLYIAMRWVEGRTLRQLLQPDHQPAPRPLAPGRALGIAAQVADALDYAHSRGIIHRDIKPENIMVEAGDRATLTDFGIARSLEGTRLTQTNMLIGTPPYMAPEQVLLQPVDHRADLYALGIVVYELLTGRPPFVGELAGVMYAHVHTAPPPANQLNPAVAPSVAAVLQRALAKDPAQRYQSGREFIAALRQVLGG